jgi:hypothetical protein
MSTTHVTSVDDCVRAVEEFFHPLQSTLTSLGQRLVPLFDEPPASDALLRAARPLALEVLADAHAMGAGFVVTPGLLADDDYLLAWWQGDGKEPLTRSPALVQSTDYSRQEWFRTPLRTGASHVTGPYVDYVCTDELTLTITVPVTRGGRMLGVMGADVLASTVEKSLLATFAGAGATLANRHHRAVLSAQPQVFAGEPVDPHAYAVSRPCRGLPLDVYA